MSEQEETRDKSLYAVGESASAEPAQIGQIPEPETEEEQKPGYLARQLSPVVEKAAVTVKEGLEKTNKDIIVGIALGIVGLLGLRYIFSRNEDE